MQGVLTKTFSEYFSNFKLVILFSVFVLLSLLLLPFVSSYVATGAGFIRFSSLVYDMTILQASIFLLVSIVSIFFISFFMTAVISIVKLRQTLDHLRFAKVAAVFPHYLMRIFLFLVFMSAISITIGVLLDLASVPHAIIQLILVVLWFLFIFTPQIIVLEDFSIWKAMADSLAFVKSSPLSLLSFIVFGFILLLILTVLEVALGQFFIWEHKLVSIFLVSLFVLPLLEILRTILYIRRYAIAKI